MPLYTNRTLSILFHCLKFDWDLNQTCAITPQILFKQRNGREARWKERLQASNFVRHWPLIGRYVQMYWRNVSCMRAGWQKTGTRRVWPVLWEESPASTTQPTSATVPPFTRWAAEVCIHKHTHVSKPLGMYSWRQLCWISPHQVLAFPSILSWTQPTTKVRRDFLD